MELKRVGLEILDDLVDASCVVCESSKLLRIEGLQTLLYPPSHANLAHVLVKLNTRGADKLTKTALPEHPCDVQLEKSVLRVDEAHPVDSTLVCLGLHELDLVVDLGYLDRFICWQHCASGRVILDNCAVSEVFRASKHIFAVDHRLDYPGKPDHERWHHQADKDTAERLSLRRCLLDLDLV